ncbi:hypothetical protein D0869_15926 [Hortaea werneckii]|uniref:Heterokaryon incompatibility domain-containing protein n=1 Tax=Hortaea werneckii TaxID=91943 RepID=A0A3M6VYZ8_HORWE|nr:hypothetical protein D0869_15926 [Hortaea werneckii]
MEIARRATGPTQHLWPLDRASIWTPLDKEKREIRILLLQPSEDEDDALYADLEVVSLDNEPEYKAISYVWGDATDTTVMFMNGGKVIEITRSLAAALRRFRDYTNFVALWADAVCINQEDLQERADQVRIMGRIYATAIQVNVWLGRMSDRKWHDSLCSRLEAQDIPRNKSVLRCLNFCLGKMLSEVVEDLDIITHRFGLDRWLAWLAVLSTCPWFSRLWVIQEVALARSAIFFSGRHSCTQDALHSVLDQALSSPHVGSRAMFRLLVDIVHMKAALQAKDLAFTSERCKIMAKYSHLPCQNDLDRVYSLLEISSHVCNFPIDYQKTTEEVYIDFAISCIANEGPGTVFVSSTCGEEPSKLPSWVPDWRGGRTCDFVAFSDSAKLHAACPVALQGLTSRHIKAERGKLGIPAFIVDRLDTCAPTSTDIRGLEDNEPLKPYELNTVLAKTFRNWQKLSWAVQDVLMQVLFCDAHPRDITRADFKKGFWTTIENASASQENILQGHDRILLQQRVICAQLFLTTSGRLGNARIGVRTGDLVALFPGCSIPFIIRPVDDVAGHRTFKLISPCYVNGMMDGEAFWDAFIAKANSVENAAFQNEFDAIKERVAAGIGNTEKKALLADLAAKHCHHLFEEIALV